MAEMPQANPVPKKPPLHLTGGYLLVAVPEDFTEAIFCIPAVRALRNGRPNGTLTVVTPEENKALWERVEGINHVVVYPAKASIGTIVELIRKTGVAYESSFAWTAGPAAKAFAKMKVRQRLGVPAPGLANKLTDVVETTAPIGPPEHALRKYLYPLARLDFDTLVPANFPVPVLPERPKRHVVGLAAGSDYGPAYRWSVKRFEELGKKLLEKHDLDLVVLNFSNEKEQSRLLADALSGLGPSEESVQDCVDRFSFEELIGALPHLSSLVCSDGSLAHLAAFVGLPVVTLFGPGDEVGRRPQGRVHQVINAYVECAGCGLAKCPIDHRCMEEIEVETVLKKVEETLGLSS